MLFLIPALILFCLMLAFCELGRRGIAGFVLTFILFAAFCVLYITLRGRDARAWVFLLFWIGWIAAFAGMFVLLYPPTRNVPAVEAKDPEKTGVVKTACGDVRGVYSADGLVEVYAGIPYAKPPVGELRWREPQDPEPWTGILDADRFAPMSMQPTNGPVYESLRQIIGYHDYKITSSDDYMPPVSEDSLYLNIWKPAGEEKDLPVLVYVHGGSLQSGQTWYSDYSGDGLAREGVIVVNMGYRLGIFGFFADEELAAESENGTTGNYGLLDQIKALEWVRDNISAFGGDPGNVTLAGESAGSACVSALCTSPLAKGLFRRAVLESSTFAPEVPPHSFRSFSDALEAGRKTKDELGCRSVAELRALPAEKLVNYASQHHHVTVDGYALTETPYESYKKGVHNEEAILHGYNSEESAAFILFERTTLKNYEKKVRSYYGEKADRILEIYSPSNDKEAGDYWAAVYGAEFFDYPHYCLNRLAAENGIPVYQYYFSRKNGRLGPWHSGEEVYLYGNVPAESRLFDERDRELGRQMTSYLVNFAKTGDPNGPGLPEWSVNSASEDVMGFGDETGMMKEPKHALFDIFDGK